MRVLAMQAAPACAAATARAPSRAAPACAGAAAARLSAQLRQRSARLGPSNGARCTAFFKFRQDSKSAGIVGSQGRDEFDRDDVEQYFNYMGCLAVEGTYDRMYALLDAGLPAIDIILLFAAAEADLPKLEELLIAGADLNVKDLSGNTPMMLAGKANPAKKAEAEQLMAKFAKK